MSLRARDVVGLALVVLVMLAPVPAVAFLGDSASHPPPATGSFAYNSFVPALTTGASYVDPVFGETVQRVTTDHNADNIYARNMWWNADETRYFHGGKIINLVTNTVEYTGIPGGDFGFDAGFDPVDPNAFYYFSGGNLHKVTLQSGGKWTDAVYWTTPGGVPFKSLGGTLNWLDASGRYMLVRYGAEPSVHLYDRQNLAAGSYANPISGTNYIDQGSYIGLSPDGQFLVGYGPGGLYNIGRGVSWAINHNMRTVAASPNEFWSLCGDHGSFLSASDGRNYMVVSNCGNLPELWRVDITNNAAGLTENQQRALPNNKLLIAWTTWSDGGHVSTVATGALRDWGFISSEDGSDVFNGPVNPWHPYRQEIIAVNVLTGEIRRLAHHRSRGGFGDYFSEPRLSASWGGKIVGFASNFNQPGVNDIFAIPFAPSVPPPALSSLSPASVATGAAGFALTVNGSNFVSSSVVQWNGATRTTTFVSSTQLQATILAGDVATTGTAQVTVVTPGPGGGTSNALTFTIAPAVSLAVVRAGSGSGTVTSAPSGITCGTNCSASFVSGTAVTLTATAAAGSTFTGWSGGGCSGTGTCTVTLTTGTTVTATFGLQSFTLTVTSAGTGSGTVTSSPAGISCGAICSASYASGTAVTLTATAAAGSAFTGWSGGGCSGTGSCTVTMSAARTVTATFAPTFALTVTPTGAGSGTVTSSPAGINCGATCSTSYTSGTVVTLTATANASSAFAGWSGGGCGGTGTCVVTLTAATTVTATFTTPTFALSVVLRGSGSGTVTSGPAGINCGTTCSATYTSGTLVTLTASPAAGAHFTRWSGACSGSGSCVVTMSAVRSVSATFSITFTHSQLTAAASVISAVDITELRSGVNTLRTQNFGLAPVTFTDPTIIPGTTVVKAAHFSELRSALAGAYAQAGVSAPTYTDPTLSQGLTVVRAVDLTEMRNALAALE